MGSTLEKILVLAFCAHEILSVTGPAMSLRGSDLSSLKSLNSLNSLESIDYAYDDIHANEDIPDISSQDHMKNLYECNMKLKQGPTVPEMDTAPEVDMWAVPYMTHGDEQWHRLDSLDVDLARNELEEKSNKNWLPNSVTNGAYRLKDGAASLWANLFAKPQQEEIILGRNPGVVDAIDTAPPPVTWTQSFWNWMNWN